MVLVSFKELETLPLYTQVAHAMHIIGPSYEQTALNNSTQENKRWLALGKSGLRYSLGLWG
jgi:hypothetical protein